MKDNETITCPGRDQAVRAFEEIVGTSASLESVLEQVVQVAPTNSTVLIQGETGTGKELIAHAIHKASPRCGNAFVKVNCAAIPVDLLESELFGHEKGAFTTAIAQKIGRLELADKGTLFLDEVGDMPPSLQPKLLRVLQEKEFERLGSNRTQQVNLRLIAATNRDLSKMVNRGTFRSDLYYRLNVFPIALPPVRHRREDIPDLVQHFVEMFSHSIAKRIDCIPEDTMAAFKAYAWPGNIREIQNLVERAVILARDSVLPNPLPPRSVTSVPSAPIYTTMRGATWGESTRGLILATLNEVGWVIGGAHGAAARLGLKRTTLHAKMKKLGISRPTPDETNDAFTEAPEPIRVGDARP